MQILTLNYQLLSISLRFVRLIVSWNQGTRNVFLQISFIGISYFKQISSSCKAMNAKIKDFKSHFGIRLIVHALDKSSSHIYSLSPAIPVKTIKTTVRNTIRNLTVT